MSANSSLRPSPVRQDVLRGIRWGIIVLIAALLGIAAYRVFGSSPASAATAKPETPVSVEPTPVQPAIEVSEGAPSTAAPAPNPGASITGPDVPAAPPPRPRRIVPPPAESAPKAFVPPSVPVRQTFQPKGEEALPDLPSVDVKPEQLPSPSAKKGSLPSNDKGSRVGNVARSVGRIFKFGRKDDSNKGK